ncbi:MAG TPA: hypothetical protein VL025_01385, partial [Thermoanaerobaculia bacterium]|nr:hypothetical protein [Thermoanaerobaculia bacterium]
GIALRERPQRLEVTRLTGPDGAEALLLESLEPLAFSEEVILKLEGELSDGTVGFHEVLVLSNGSETHALVFPVESASTDPVSLSGGDYRLLFSLDRARFRSATPDPVARYRAEAVLEVDW